MQYINSIFYCLCLICAFALSFWCTSEYAKNKEITEISFQRFNPIEEERQYPSMTLCLTESYKDLEFYKYNESTINSTSYSKFLAGINGTMDMFFIDYDSVTIDVRDYIIDSCIVGIDGLQSASDCQKFGRIEYYTRMTGVGVTKCFSFKHDSKEPIDETYIALNTSIFSKGVRPTFGRFLILFHYPDQIFTGNRNIFYKWPVRANPMDEFYHMHFGISNVEILHRRKKGRERCYDWKRYDFRVIDDVMRSVGCQPPYWKSKLGLPSCRSQQELRNLRVQWWSKNVQDERFQKYFPPCIEITKMDVSFEEVSAEELSKQGLGYEAVDDRFIKKAGTARGWFVINTSLWQSASFKEIRKVRAYSFQSMIGNSGGYIGLLAGISISDLSCVVLRIYFALKGMFMYHMTSI